MESGFELRDTLGRMGMPDAFGPKADFSGMDGTQNLYIQNTEAAANNLIPLKIGG
jgi:serine protease inhibitor